MRLFSEILKGLEADEDYSMRLQYSVIDGKGAYFQNVKCVREFSDALIVLQGRRDCIRIEGKNLSFGKYFQGDVTVLGDIQKIERGQKS